MLSAGIKCIYAKMVETLRDAVYNTNIIYIYTAIYLNGSGRECRPDWLCICGYKVNLSFAAGGALEL